MLLEWAKTRPLGLDELETDAAHRYTTQCSDPLVRGDEIRCCFRGCTHWLAKRHRAKNGDGSYCSEHGISVSTSPTYVYRDYRRNFVVAVPLLERMKHLKAESWRLGNERSEDALSWNVFVGLKALGGLGAALQQLTGYKAEIEPELYLWGIRIDANDPVVWERLKTVRADLGESTELPTEPDIILRVPGRVTALVEAKFGSSNGTLAGKQQRFGTVIDFLDRYPSVEGLVDPLDRTWIKQKPADHILEQLCRNVIFAQRLALDGELAYVVNLVRESDNTNVHAQFSPHLTTPMAVHFGRATWEELYRLDVMQTANALPLKHYLHTKTSRLAKALAI